VEAVDRIAGMILKSLSNPFVLEQATVHIGASIGVAIYPGDGTNANELLSAADGAMYRVKKAGRNGVGYASKR
jgi:diguanylate cyclase (GGDEF)-like protein